MTALADQIRACAACPLRDKQDDGCGPVPPYVGQRYGRGGIAIVCEAPGFNEAKQGVPLVGKAGQLFNKLAQAAGMERSMFFLTNSVRCRPPGNRIQDYPEAVNACGQWTETEFSIYDPAIVVLMGRVAMRQVFGAEATVGQTRGSFAALPAKHPWGRRLVLATYHPAAAIYGGGEDSEPGKYIVQDLRAAMTAWRAMRSR